MKIRNSQKTQKLNYLLPFIASFLLLFPIFLYLHWNSNILNQLHSQQFRKTINELNDESGSGDINSKSEAEQIKDYLQDNNNFPKIDSSPQRILLAGDSMADGLIEPLKSYCEKNHHKLINAGWTSSTIIGWSGTHRLANLVKKHKPTIVIMVLGANELYTTELKIREKLVKQIEKEAGDIKFVWIGPPHWREDNGLDNMFKEVLGEGKYFSSKSMFLSPQLKNKRGGDKKHPSQTAYKIWADSLSSWIMTKSNFPIVLEKPN